MAWRWREIPVEPEEETPALSRSVLFILGIASFCALAFVILLGTSAPLLTRLSGNPSQVQTSFYGRTTTPAAALIALLAGLVAFVSWKGESWRGLLASARRSLLVAAAGVGLALVLGATNPGSLLLLFLAFFAADMNLRAVLRKAGNGKLGGAGGYLAHVGFGIMLAGIVVSGVYAKSTRLTLPAGKPVRVGGNTLTFLRVLPATATEKQAMEVRVRTAEGKTFYAYPKMYVNSRTNQLMANPSIRRTAAADLYLAPQSYDPGQPEQIGRDVRLTKGTTQNIDGIGLTFRDFNADRSAMMRGEKTILVLADVTVTAPDGVNRDTTLRYTWNLETREADAVEADVPGVPGGKMRVVAVSPNDGAAVLRLTGVSKDPKAEHQAATDGVALPRRDAKAPDLARVGRLLRAHGRGDAGARQADPGGSAGRARRRGERAARGGRARPRADGAGPAGPRALAALAGC